ncbi:MAG: helix-turn-helix domain-containing protein [Spirosomataceae bacterium]
MNDILSRFGLRLKGLRQERGLTQEQLAKLCGLHKNYIGMVERGERNPSLKNIEVIANAFDIPISKLMEFSEYQKVSSNV